MPAPYAALRDRMVAETDKRFAETVSFVPVVDGLADAGAAAEIVAVLRTATQAAGHMDGGKSSQWNVDIAAGSATLFVSKADYPEFSARTGDRVKAIDRAGAPWFEVARFDGRSHTRWIVHLTEL